MPYGITCSTKTLTLVKASFLFIFLGVMFEFVMVLCVYILLSPQEEEVHHSSWRQWCTDSAAHSSKRFKPFFTSCYYSKVVVELEKTQTRYSAVL